MKLFNIDIFATGKARSLNFIPSKNTYRLMADRRHGFSGMDCWIDIVKNSSCDGFEKLTVDVKPRYVDFHEAF